MEEQWHELKGHREIYMISNHGNAKTKTRQGARGSVVYGHDLNKTENSNGYLRVSMRLEGDRKSKSYLIHRLVAKEFIPTKDGKDVVNHLDGDKHNNLVSNLEWCDKSENELHAHRTGLKKTTPLKGELHGGRKFDWDDVNNIRNEYVKGSRKHGQCALARKYNTSQAHICEIVHNRIWKDE